jgi:membrane associated rhomboid family serine protease
MDQYFFTYLIIGITSAVTLYAFRNNTFFEKSLFSIDAIIGSNDYYRIFTSVFVHANIGHLFFNMFSFYAFATGIEMKYGPKVTAYLYLYSGLGAGILSLLLHRKDKNYRAVGASGAVCGIIFASIFLIPGGSIIVFPIPVPIPAWAYALLFVFGSIYATNRMAGGIAHDAHLGGALAGILTAGTIDYQALTANPLLLGAVVIPIVLFFVFNRQIGYLLQKK